MHTDMYASVRKNVFKLEEKKIKGREDCIICKIGTKLPVHNYWNIKVYIRAHLDKVMTSHFLN